MKFFNNSFHKYIIYHINYVVLIICFLGATQQILYSQDYIFTAIEDQHYENSNNWTPVFLESTNRENWDDIEIRNFCTNYNQLDNFGFIVNKGQFISSFNFNAGLIINYNFFEGYLFNDGEFANSGSMHIYGFLENESELYNRSQIIAKIINYSGSILDIGYGELGTILDRAVFENYSGGYAIEQKPGANIKFYLRNPNEHTRMKVEGKIKLDGNLRLYEGGNPEGGSIPKSCGVYTLIEYSEHDGEFNQFYYNENIGGFVQPGHPGNYNMKLKYWEDRLEMITFYPESNTFIGTNTNWEDPANWSSNKIPNTCSEVVIPDGKQVILPPDQIISINTLVLSNDSDLIIPSTSELLIYNILD